MGQRSQQLRAAGIAACVVVAVALVPSGAEAERGQGAAPPPELLRLGAAASTSADHVEDARRVAVDTSLLAPGRARTVSLDLIRRDLQVALVPIASGAPGWAAWNGAVIGEPDASATVVRNGDDVAALVTTLTGSYRVRTTAPGQQVVQVIDGTFPERPDDTRVPSSVRDLQEPAATASDLPTTPVIDVLVGYTPGALAQAGTASAMASEIALAVAITNTAYADSGVAGRIRLAGTTALTEELTISDASLDRLTDEDDGSSDQIHALRNRTGADLVSILTTDEDSCGLAWILQGLSAPSERSRYGFSLVDLACAVDNFSFPHELGHNMGLDHDRYLVPTPTLFPYAVGYVNAAKGWRTVMAYNTECEDLGTTCTRLGRFSNPDRTLAGAPLGRPADGPAPADNRRALNATQHVVANWRATPAPFTTWARFVTQQHRDFLERTPTRAEAAREAAVLDDGGTTPQAYLEAKLHGAFSDRFAPVARLYDAYLQRAPDVGGLDHWVRKYRAGLPLTAISSNFAASSEFEAKYGKLSNRAFVLQIYRNLFDRTGDPGGVAYWTRQLDTRAKTRGQVMAGFSESSQFQRVRAEEIDVVLVHRALLRRAPSPAELADQAARLEQGTSIRRILLEVLASAEYAGRIAA